MKLFGIKQCDTVRKARRFLDQQGHTYQFHDWRTDGICQQTLQSAANSLGWDALLNKRSTSWRNLDDAQRSQPAQQLLIEHPTLIKRPLLQTGSGFLLGFNAAAWADKLQDGQ